MADRPADRPGGVLDQRGTSENRNGHSKGDLDWVTQRVLRIESSVAACTPSLPATGGSGSVRVRSPDPS